MPTIIEILQFLDQRQWVQLAKFQANTPIEQAVPLNEARVNTITFCRVKVQDPETILAVTPATLAIVDQDIPVNPASLAESGLQAVIISPNARLDFSRVVQQFFTPQRPVGIHSTAIISAQAQIAPNVYIGPYCVVGAAIIGPDTVIHSGVHIYDNVRIGRNVTIHSGCIIGADGFGFERDDVGQLEKFPQIGGVVIEDDVDICAQSHVARAALGDTVIGQGTKIDAMVHVAHNCKVGRHCVLTAQVMLAGGVTIGDYSWVAPSAAVLNGITIGSRAMVGLGAVVIKNVNDNATVAGVPARDLGQGDKKKTL